VASALVLSHLFPSSARPGVGPFVADEVAALNEDIPVSVIAPVRWVPPAPVAGWQRERAVPRSTQNGLDVLRPRVLALPFAGLHLETQLWPTQLRRLVRATVATKDVRLIHAHFALPNGWAAVRLGAELGLPVFVTLYGSDVLVFGRNPRLRPMLVEVVRAAERTIAVSEELAEEALRLGAPPERVSVLTCGVPSAVADATTHLDARRALGLVPGDEWILWVGGLVEVKQPLQMIETLAALHEARPNVRLAMVGDGPLAAELERAVTAHGLEDHVRLLGYLPRRSVASWQHAANVICNTSRSEGTPVALVEALVCGTSVAAYPVGGIPSLLRRIGVGSLAAASTPTMLARAIGDELGRVPDRALVASAADALRLERSIAPLREQYAEVVRD
jgi:glycosyltransferase involved in cell wall biosynthesis